MTTAPLLLIAAALADWFISLKPFKTIAGRFSLEPEQLENDLPPRTKPHTFRGQLEAALAEPDVRPDLIPQKIHLARLEEQLTFLLKQRDRAEECIDRVQSRAEGVHDAELMKAEIFANRVQQQCVKLIKDIEKDRKALQKSLQEAIAESAQTTATSMTKSAAPQSKIAQPPIPPTQAIEPSRTQVLPTQIQYNPITAGASQIPLTPPPTDEEFLNCLVSNRHRLKDTPEKDRQKLIARLIEEHRIKKDRAKTITRAA